MMNRNTYCSWVTEPWNSLQFPVILAFHLMAEVTPYSWHGRKLGSFGNLRMHLGMQERRIICETVTRMNLFQQ